MPRYTYTVAADGLQLASVVADGRDIPLTDNQELSDFLSFQSRQKPPEQGLFANLPELALFFSDKETFLRWVKHNNAALWGDADVKISTGVHGFKLECEGRGMVIYDRLSMAQCKAPGSGDEDAFAIDYATRVYVSHALYNSLKSDMQDETSDARRLSVATVDRTFVYVDISEFSQYTSAHQFFVVNRLLRYTTSDDLHISYLWRNITNSTGVRDAIEAALCIGDGYIYVFQEPQAAILFAATLAYIIEDQRQATNVKIHFRIGIDAGPVRFFWDPYTPTEGRWNYVGTGIITAQRILSAIGPDSDDVVYISGELRDRVLATTSILPGRPIQSFAISRGRRKDKHGNMRRVYEINHMGWLGGDFRADIRPATQEKQ